MPKTITQVNTADTYTDQGGANINSAYQSKGGWCTMSAQVMAQIQHSSAPDQSQGQEQWSDEFVLPAGAHYLQPGIIGIRFRSFTTGVPVAVSAAIFYRDEEAIQLGGSGISSPSSSVASLNFQHNDVAVATEPTADFEDGTNVLTWSVVDDLPNTRVKITPSFPNTVLFPGTIEIGAADVPLSRKSANNLQLTGASFWVDNSVVVDNLNAGGGVYFGSSLDTLLSRLSAGALGLTNQLSINTATTHGAGTLTSSDRIFSGAAGTGGIWVDGGSTQFFGSVDASHIGLYNSQYWILLDNAGSFSNRGQYAFQTGVGTGGIANVTGTSTTLNTIVGLVSYNAQANTASVLKTFILSNNKVGPNDTVHVSVNGSNTTAAGQIVCSTVVGSGTFSIVMLCNSANASANYAFNFWVIKGAVT